MRIIINIAVVLVGVSSFGLLTGCGGGSSGGAEGSNTGQLNIGLTDAPIENASKVVVAFSGVEIKPKDGSALGPFPIDELNCDDYDVATELCSIDLLSLTGTERTIIFAGDVEAGQYNWIRLAVEAEKGVIDSYIEFKDGTQCSLYVPSGSQSGLKVIGGITVTANGTADYTLDFDLKKSIVQPKGQLSDLEQCVEDYFLKPVVRITDTTETGDIFGIVDDAVLAADTSCEMDQGFYENVAVYVFDSADVLDDLDGIDDAITTAVVEWDGLEYSYEVGYLVAPSEYKLGLTCTADLDLPADSDDFSPEDIVPSIEDESFSFISNRLVETVVGEIVDGSFLLDAP